MSAPLPLSPWAERGSLPRRIASALGVLSLRGAALVLFALMSLAEPFLAVVLGFASLACFSVAMLFGFILHAPFPHRWFVLGASVFFLMLYLAYRFAMLGVQKLLA